MADFGMNLRVTMDSKQGGRKYMEDVLSVKFQKTDDGRNIEYTYLAVFDGHGGAEAAKFAKEHLLDEITKQKGFWSNDEEEVKKAIKGGFLSTHKMMWNAVGSWPKTLSGYPSTAGTTASVCFIRNGKIFIAHVGDSTVVLGEHDGMSDNRLANVATDDHKPESPQELKRIESVGGQVVAKAGVQRVVWSRRKNGGQGPMRRNTLVDNIPFLAIARALGDLWSYNATNDQFVVSPVPDISVETVDLKKHKFIILASDGLWNMVKPQDAVDIVHELDPQSKDPYHGRKPASFLVHLALERWSTRMLRADNTSVIVAYFDPPGSHKDQLLRQPSDVSTVSTLKASDGEDSMSDAEIEEIFPAEDIDIGEDSHQMSSALAGMTPPPRLLTSENLQKPPLKRVVPMTKPSLAKRPLSPRSAPPRLPASRVFKSAQRHSHAKSPSGIGLSESAKRYNMMYNAGINDCKLVPAEVVIDSENDPNKVSIISVTLSPSPQKRPISCVDVANTGVPSKRARLASPESSQVGAESPMPGQANGICTKNTPQQGQKNGGESSSDHVPLNVELPIASSSMSNSPMISPLWPSHLADDLSASPDSVTVIKAKLGKSESIPRDVLQENMSTVIQQQTPSNKQTAKLSTPAKSPTQGLQNRSPMTRSSVKKRTIANGETLSISLRQTRKSPHSSKLQTVHRPRIVTRRSHTPKRS